MSRNYRLGRLAGLTISAEPSALAATLGLGALAATVAAWRGVRGPQALGVAPAVVALHWAGELGHQWGHATAARYAGYPMIGLRLWGPLSASLYPPDEPDLPAAVHIRRALGGPTASALISLTAALVFSRVSPRRRVLRALAGFALLENLLVFTLGAFVPLGFNDGSTLLYWWGKDSRDGNTKPARHSGT